MAAKKDGKTNKTAHVLSLLTEPEEVKAEVASDKETVPAPAPAASAALPVLEVVRANDDAISGKIKDELAKELEMELMAQAPAAKTESVEVAAPQDAEKPTAMQEQEVISEAPAPGDTPVVPVSAELPTQETAASSAQTEEVEIMAPPPPSTKANDITCVNIMQELVEEKAGKYIKMFGLCTCPRCRIDVIALALTNLPAKYVVTKQSEATPMLTVYEGRYNTAVISQVMWACKRVLDFPRHEI